MLSTKWTNVEEDLPKESGLYQVAIQTGPDFFHITTRYFHADKGFYWHKNKENHCWNRRTLGVFQWAPLPDLKAEDYIIRHYITEENLRE